MVHLIPLSCPAFRKLQIHLKVSLWIPPHEQETKRIQDIRNKIDYDRLFSYEKYAFLSRKQRHLQLLYIDSPNQRLQPPLL